MLSSIRAISFESSYAFEKPPPLSGKHFVCICTPRGRRRFVRFGRGLLRWIAFDVLHKLFQKGRERPYRRYQAAVTKMICFLTVIEVYDDRNKIGFSHIFIMPASYMTSNIVRHTYTNLTNSTYCIINNVLALDSFNIAQFLT